MAGGSARAKTPRLLPAFFARHERHARFQPLELDPGAGTGAQQTVGRLAQAGAALGRIVVERGVVVGRVDNGSAAENGGVSDGDIVVAINQEPVNTPQQAAAKLNEAAHSSKKSALLLLNRHGVTEYVGVNLDGGNQG